MDRYLISLALASALALASESVDPECCVPETHPPPLTETADDVQARLDDILELLEE